MKLRRITLYLLQLKEDLEQSISQLRSQRLRRTSGGRSVSVTSLSASDLDGGAVAGKPLPRSKSDLDGGTVAGKPLPRSKRDLDGANVR